MKKISSNLIKYSVLIAVLLFLSSCSSVHTQLIIPAQPEKVWSVLMDAPGYKEWNPVLVPIKGELREGEIIKYKMTQPNGETAELEAEVIKIDKGKELNQYGGLWGFLTFDHRYILEPVEGGTQVTQHEDYRGIGVWFWDECWVEPAYQKVNEALRDRVIQLQENEKNN